MSPALVILVAASVVLLPAAWWLAPRLHRFAYWGVPCTADAIAGLATDGWRSDVLAVEPGVALAGLVRPPADSGAPWLLFLPGNAAAIAASFRPVLDAVLAERAVGAAFWPWRGFDASSGLPSPDGLTADARAGWRCVVGLAGAADRVEIWGYSLGSIHAVRLAAELCRQGTPPRRLVLLSASGRIPVMRATPFGRWWLDDQHDAIAVAAEVTCPVVFVHGEADDALPIAGARELAALVHGPVRFVALPGRGHVDYLGELAVVVP